MPSRLFLFAVICLLGSIPTHGLAQQPGQADDPARAGEIAPATVPTAAVGKEVEQAILAVGTALDRLEADASSESGQEVLEEITSQLEFIKEKDPGNGQLPFLLGRTYAMIGRHREAVDQLQDFVATREGRNEWRAFQLMGDLLVDQYPQLAKANYDSAAALRVNEPKTLFGLARCAAKRGRTAEAIRMTREAVQADGRQTVLYLSFLARMLARDAQWAEAKREAAAAVALAAKDLDRDPTARRPVEILNAQYNLTIEILEACVAQGEAGAEDYARLAAFVRDRAKNTAKLALHDALAIIEAGANGADSDAPLLMEQHGAVLAELGRREEARAMFQKLLEVDRQNRTATAWLERLGHGAAEPPTPDKP
jgi:tetratricopeptide (TPR) repeat protein